MPGGRRARRNWAPLLEEAERRGDGRRGLEVGSSNGAFLRRAAERGWDVAAVEVDAGACGSELEEQL